MENHDATQPHRGDDRPGSDLAAPAGGDGAGGGAGLGRVGDAQRYSLERAIDDLGIVIACQEVMDRRGFVTNHDTRHHLEEIVRVLTLKADVGQVNDVKRMIARARITGLHCAVCTHQAEAHRWIMGDAPYCATRLAGDDGVMDERCACDGYEPMQELHHD